MRRVLVVGGGRLGAAMLQALATVDRVMTCAVELVADLDHHMFRTLFGDLELEEHHRVNRATSRDVKQRLSAPKAARHVLWVYAS